MNFYKYEVLNLINLVMEEIWLGRSDVREREASRRTTRLRSE